MDPIQLSHTVLYRGRIIDLEVDEVQYPSGNTGIREVARHPGGAVTVPLFSDGTVLLVRQYRYPFKAYTLELPAGKLDIGEDPEAAARRELDEETGWIAGKLEKLTSFYTTPGFCDEVLHVYLATELAAAPHGPRREEGELTMSLVMVPLANAVRMIETGELHDSKTIIGILLAERKLRSGQ